MLGNIRAESINLVHFHQYKKKRLEEDGSNRSINKEIAYISSFYKWGKQHGYLSGLPFRIERLPYKRPIPNILSFNETVRFIKAATPDIYRVLFLTIYNLGTRFDEARNIRWENVDTENRTITVKGKGNKERRLPYGSWLHEELLRLTPKKGYILYIKKDRKTNTERQEGYTESKKGSRHNQAHTSTSLKALFRNTSSGQRSKP